MAQAFVMIAMEPWVGDRRTLWVVLADTPDLALETARADGRDSAALARNVCLWPQRRVFPTAPPNGPGAFTESPRTEGESSWFVLPRRPGSGATAAE